MRNYTCECTVYFSEQNVLDGQTSTKTTIPIEANTRSDAMKKAERQLADQFTTMETTVQSVVVDNIFCPERMVTNEI